MRVAPTLALMVLCACATPSRDAWLSNATNRSEALCWWRDVRWEDRAALLVRGTGATLGRAKATRGPFVTGTLRLAGQVPLLQGRWEGEGLWLDAEVDLGADAVIASWEARRIGLAGLLLKGTRMRVLDARLGTLLAVPGEASLSVFKPEEPLAIELGCENVSLRSGEEVPERQLQLAGFSAEAPRVQLTPGFPLELTAQPAAEVAGTLRTEPPLAAWEVKREGDAVRVAVPTRDGLLWVGWVDGARVKSAAAVPPSAEPTPLELTNTMLDWRRCRQSVEVAVLVDGRVHKVGLLAPGATFALAADVSSVDQWVPARLGVDWFEPADGVHLLLPGEVRRCDAVNRTW